MLLPAGWVSSLTRCRRDRDGTVFIERCRRCPSAARQVRDVVDGNASRAAGCSQSREYNSRQVRERTWERALSEACGRDRTGGRYRSAGRYITHDLDGRRIRESARRRGRVVVVRLSHLKTVEGKRAAIGHCHADRLTERSRLFLNINGAVVYAAAK